MTLAWRIPWQPALKPSPCWSLPCLHWPQRSAPPHLRTLRGVQPARGSLRRVSRLELCRPCRPSSAASAAYSSGMTATMTIHTSRQAWVGRKNDESARLHVWAEIGSDCVVRRFGFRPFALKRIALSLSSSVMRIYTSQYTAVECPLCLLQYMVCVFAPRQIVRQELFVVVSTIACRLFLHGGPVAPPPQPTAYGQCRGRWRRGARAGGRHA